MLNKIKINKKTMARIAAIQSLYQYEFFNMTPSIESIKKDIIAFHDNIDVTDYDLDDSTELKLSISYKYFDDLLLKASSNMKQIDETIKSNLQDFDLKYQEDLVVAILRVGVSEIYYFDGVPKNVIISEYTNIASSMINGKKVNFVNSILDKIATPHSKE